MGIGTKQRSRLRSLRVEFGIEPDELRFPSRAFSTTHLWRDGATRRLQTTVAQSYAEHEFFGVESAEEFGTLTEEEMVQEDLRLVPYGCEDRLEYPMRTSPRS